MEPKAKTLIEKFGFRDADLTSPKHDDICLGITKEKAFEICKSFGWKNEIKPCQNKKQIIRNIDKKIPNCQYSEKAKLWDCGMPHGKFEDLTYITENYNHDIYIDIDGYNRIFPSFNDGTLEKECLITYAKIKQCIDTINKDMKEFQSLDRTPKIKVDFEVPIKSGKFILGFCDCKITITKPKLSTEYTTEEEKVSIYYIEVKTTILSFGELMRQINMYKDVTNGNWIVISPDDRFATHIKEQGTGFYKWESSK